MLGYLASLGCAFSWFQFSYVGFIPNPEKPELDRLPTVRA